MSTTRLMVVGSNTDPDPGVESIANKVNSVIYLPVFRVVVIPHIMSLSLGEPRIASLHVKVSAVGCSAMHLGLLACIHSALDHIILCDGEYLTFPPIIAAMELFKEIIGKLTKLLNQIGS
jgi:hypothetical protein